MNLDAAFIGEFVTRSGLSAFLDIPTMWSTMNNYISGNGDPASVDYYQAGIEFGKIVKSIFDLNINN